MKTKLPETKGISAPPIEIGLKGGLRKAKPSPEQGMRKLSYAEQKDLDVNLLKFARKKNWEVVGELVGRGARDSERDRLNYTALTYLAEAGKTEIIRKLMLNGGCISLKDCAARAGYIKASCNGHTETVKYFLKNSDFIDGCGGIELSDEELYACMELMTETYMDWTNRG